jgi:2-phosphoglycerate kinase
MAARPCLLLIFGTSHVGKSTLAGRLGAALGWRVTSTDGLARHPGRPWPEVRPPVAEFYSSLSDDTVYWFLRTHHENTWPYLRRWIVDARRETRGNVLEGTALRPEYVAELDRREVLPLGLHADPAFLRRRIESESAYSGQDGPTKLLIDKFIERTLRDNEMIVEAASRLGLPLWNVADADELERRTADLIGTLASAARGR